jgi:class 3 adenylate cyclase
MGHRAWPSGAIVRVRIGLHTGRPTVTDSGYVGLAVNMAARVCAAGHGGQVLLSESAVRAVEAFAPAGVAFRPLGEHRLQGMPEPQALFQLEAPDLPKRFPRPRTAPAARRSAASRF